MTDSPTDTATRAMRALVDDRIEGTRDDEGFTEYRTTPSLLVVLHESIRSSMGAGSGGGGGAGGTGGVNYRAFTLWSDIEGQARAWARKYDVASSTSVRALLQAVAARADALRDDAQIATDEYEHLVAAPGRWVERILDMLDPPRSAEITAPCPACGERYVLNYDDERVGTLVTASRPGSDPRAECRHCHETWEGETELGMLAFAIGANAVEEHVEGSAP